MLKTKLNSVGARHSLLKWVWLLPLCGLFVFWNQKDTPQLDNTDTIVIMKANFLFHFAASNDWPEEAKVGPFRIGVAGNERLVEELVDKYALKTIRQQVLEVIEIDAEDLKSRGPDPFCHVLYVEPGVADLGKLEERLKGEPTLLVGHEPGAMDRGALINFVTESNRLRYTINTEAAEKRNLLISSRILSWAVEQ